MTKYLWLVCQQTKINNDKENSNALLLAYIIKNILVFTLNSTTVFDDTHINIKDVTHDILRILLSQD